MHTPRLKSGLALLGLAVVYAATSGCAATVGDPPRDAALLAQRAENVRLVEQLGRVAADRAALEAEVDRLTIAAGVLGMKLSITRDERDRLGAKCDQGAPRAVPARSPEAEAAYDACCASCAGPGVQ
jgi:hypothetical protein